MPFIIKNGKYYGSSADGSVDITQDEYDELKASGQINPSVTYYITDGVYEDESNSGNANIIELTQEEYDSLPESKNSDCIMYYIKDGDDLSAKNMVYDGSTTGLGNNVQSAIDNLNDNVLDVQSQVDAKTLAATVSRHNQFFTKSIHVSGTKTFVFKSRFDSIGSAGSRQSVFMFCMSNGTPVYGLINIDRAGSASWTGTGSVTATMDSTGNITVTLPVITYDRVTLMSGEPIE